MRIALAGTGLLGLSLLRPLLESKHEVVALIQNGRTTRGLARCHVRQEPMLGCNGTPRQNRRFASGL